MQPPLVVTRNNHTTVLLTTRQRLSAGGLSDCLEKKANTPLVPSTNLARSGATSEKLIACKQPRPLFRLITIMADGLDRSLDDMIGQGRGGKARARGVGRRVGTAPFSPYKNTAGHSHKAGASLEEIAAAGDDERRVPGARSLPTPAVGHGSRLLAVQGAKNQLHHLGQDGGGAARPSRGGCALPQLSFWALCPPSVRRNICYLAQGSIAHVTREGGAPALLPLGASCINQAVKGIAIARGRVTFSLPPKRAARLFGRSGAPLG